MSPTNNKYKKWMLHTHNQWPSQALLSDPLVCSWNEDRALNPYDWEEQSISAERIPPPLHSTAIYIDYLNSSHLTQLLGDGAIWCLLDCNGVLLELDGSVEFKRKLHKLNINIGFSFNQQLIGTTAFSLSRKTNSTALTYRYETYKKALHDLPAICTPVTNYHENYYLMVIFNSDNENRLYETTSTIEQIARYPSKLIRRTRLLESALDLIPKIVCVFQLNGELEFINKTAKNLLKHNAIQIESITEISLNKIFGTSEYENVNISTKTHKIIVNIKREFKDGYCICFADIASESLRDLSWQYQVISQSLAKDAYISKIIEQKQKTGLRLLVTTEIGGGVEYIVDYINHLIPDKKLNKLDCLADFTLRTMNEVVKSHFLRHLLNANGNILCLYNIESLAPELQTILLKTLSSNILIDENGQHQAFNVDLISCASPSFNWDLSYLSRLLFLKTSIAQLDLHPLSLDRKILKEILLRTLEQLNQQEEGHLKYEDSALDMLIDYRWPGNFLEVFQTIENAVAHCNNGIITIKDLPDRIKSKTTKNFNATNLADAERLIIESAWRENNGHTTNVAKALGLSRTTLWRKMKKLNLDSNILSDSIG